MTGGRQPADVGRPRRRDALPEYVHYLDTGCDIHPSCLTCPLARCRYDDPAGLRLAVAAERERGIVRLREQSVSPNAIARRYGVSRRTVFRVLASARAKGVLPAAGGCSESSPRRTERSRRSATNGRQENANLEEEP